MKRYIRDAVFDEINKWAVEDESIVIMTADASAYGLKEFQQKYPERYYNVGIAEQAMLTVAAGMALAGKKVFVYAMAPFVTLRCLEQIKINICAMDLPVYILGLGIGYAYGLDGPSHSSVFDVGIMTTLPNMTVYNPIDYISASYCVKECLQRKKPAYIRIDKDAFDDLYDGKADMEKGFGVINKVESDLLLISTGICTHYAKEERNDITIIDVYNINHFCKDKMIELIRQYEKIVIYEEQWMEAGLGSVISNMLIDYHTLPQVQKIGLSEEDCYDQSFGTRSWLHKKYGIAKEVLGGI